MSVIEYALRYLPRTIPILPGTKRPATGNGWPDWEATEASVTAWWREHPDHGVGIRLGHGLVTLDVDPRHDGHVELEQLICKHGPLPLTAEAATGRGDGGRHLYFGASEDQPAWATPGLQLKAAGGQVLAPPSIHPEAKREYAWIRPLEDGLAPLPDWLTGPPGARRATRKGGAGAGAGSGSKSDPEWPVFSVPVGSRHTELVRFCGLLRSYGLAEEAIVTCGLAFLEHHVELSDDTPLDIEHAKRSMRGIARRYPPWPNRGGA